MAKTYNSMIPSIEQRESGWIHMQERLAQAPLVTPLPAVTISRQYGCEGHLLAQRLKALLEEASGHPWGLFDKALLDRVSTDEPFSRQFLSHLGDESHAQDILRSHFGYLTQNDAYAALVKHLVQIATAGSAIIVGHGGAIVCQHLSNCRHFRLEGSLAFRARTLARRLGVPQEEAEHLVRTRSRLRERFIKECLHEDITETRWFDAVFNNERLGVEAIAQACLRVVLEGSQGRPVPAAELGQAAAR